MAKMLSEHIKNDKLYVKLISDDISGVIAINYNYSPTFNTNVAGVSLSDESICFLYFSPVSILTNSHAFDIADPGFPHNLFKVFDDNIDSVILYNKIVK